MECKRVDVWFIVGYLCEKWMLPHGICKVVWFMFLSFVRDFLNDFFEYLLSYVMFVRVAIVIC